MPDNDTATPEPVQVPALVTHCNVPRRDGSVTNMPIDEAVELRNNLTVIIDAYYASQLQAEKAARAAARKTRKPRAKKAAPKRRARGPRAGADEG